MISGFCCVSSQGENVEPTADWFTEEPTHPAETSSKTPGSVQEEVEEVEEDNSLDEGAAAPTPGAEDALPTGDMENEIVAVDGRGRRYNAGRAVGEEVTSENMWERQEVLAGEDDL